MLAFKGLLTQLWGFIYGSEDLKQNTRKPWLGGINIRAILPCFEYSAEGKFITKEDIFSFISFPLFQFPWHKFSFCRFRKKKKLRAAPSNAVTNYAKCFAGLGVRLCTFVFLMTFNESL